MCRGLAPDCQDRGACARSSGRRTARRVALSRDDATRYLGVMTPSESNTAATQPGSHRTLAATRPQLASFWPGVVFAPHGVPPLGVIGAVPGPATRPLRA